MALLASLGSLLVGAIVALFRAVIAAKDAQIQLLLHLAEQSTDQTDRAQRGWRKARGDS